MTPIRILIAGHVDHGKSTLVGRLLMDSGQLPDGRLEAARTAAQARGQEAEWSYLLDSLQAEREQAVTIDTTQASLRLNGRPYILIDAPGHREFLRNMMTGASRADAVMLVIDGKEGLRDQTRQHLTLAALMGLKQVVVVINKMDAAGYAEAIYHRLAEEAVSCLSTLGLAPLAIIPVSAQTGEGLLSQAASLSWYEGPCLQEALALLQDPPDLSGLPLRLQVQDVYRIDGRRVIAAYIQSGTIGSGDTLMFFPQQETAVVQSLQVWPEGTVPLARAGDCVGLILKDDLYIERGMMGCGTPAAPTAASVSLDMLWLAHDPLTIGKEYRARTGASEIIVRAQTIDAAAAHQALGRHMFGRVTFRVQGRYPLQTGDKLAVFDAQELVAAGAVRHVEAYPKSDNIFPVHYSVTPAMRTARNHHAGAIFWLTGLSGAGKSTLAMAVEKELFNRGLQVYALDGDNMRRGLNSDLGFSPQDRRENIRRTGEVAALLADAGFIVLTAFISPYRADRDKARAAAPGRFHEIYVAADLETCEARDPKGLYKKVRAGEISGFTGIDAPYEAPLHAELTLDTQTQSVETCVRQMVEYITQSIKASHDQ